MQLLSTFTRQHYSNSFNSSDYMQITPLLTMRTLEGSIAP